MANQDGFKLPGIAGKRIAITAGARGIGLEIARVLNALLDAARSVNTNLIDS